jgi:hypothetical protein
MKHLLMKALSAEDKIRAGQSLQQLTTALPGLEAIRDRILSRWKVHKRAQSKERIKEAVDKLIAEVRS